MLDRLTNAFKVTMRNLLESSPPPDDDYWYGTTGTNTSAGVRVTQESALSGVSVWACNKILTDTVGTLSFDAMERIGADEKRLAPNYPVHRILHDQANDRQTSTEFWGDFVTGSLNLWGNAYALPEYRSDRLVNLWPLRPDRMQVALVEETGMRAYVYTDMKGNRVPYIEGDLFHVSGYSFDGVAGASPVEILRDAIGHGIAGAQYGQRFFKNNALPERWIEHPGKLGDKAKSNLTDWFRKRFGGVANAHKLGILEEGMSIKHVPINHRDLQLLELLKFNLEDVARIYRVPLHLLGHLDKMSFNNVEQLDIDYAKHTIRPICVRQEKRVNADLIGQPRFFARYNLDGLLRGDAESRSKLYAALFQNASATPNEIRAMEGKNPHSNPAANELHVQGATVPLGTQPAVAENASLARWRDQVNNAVAKSDLGTIRDLAREILNGGTAVQ